MIDNYIIILYTTMATMRLYKKRSYKKRRTIRKLKTTLRRKIQRGGNILVVKFALILFLGLFGNSPIFQAFIKILQILAGIELQVGGNGKNFKQRGGGKLSEALQQFNNAVQMDGNIVPETKQQIADCVGKLSSTNEEIIMPATNTPEAEAAEQAIAADTQNVLNAQNQVQDNSATNTNGGLIDSIKAKYSGLIDKVKTYYVSKAEGLTSDKKECIKILLTAGFSIMEMKLSAITVKEVMTAKAKAAAENLSQNVASASAAVKDVFGTSFNSAKDAFGAFGNVLQKSKTAQDAKSLFNTAKGSFGF
jgi:hypothetical protein